MFEPRVALASLSGRSDAEWARSGAAHAGAAFLGGVALDEPTREAARQMVERDREEFLPDDPLAFVAGQLDAVAGVPVRPAVNVRCVSPEPVRAIAETCATRDAILELNAHCRQEEMCTAGAGETLLRESERLERFVAVAAESDATVSVKVRTEVAGVDLPALAARLEDAGADAVHVDAMDSEPVVADVVDATDLFVIANNEVRDRETVREYLGYGADAVSVGRPSDDPVVLSRVREAVAEWFATDGAADGRGSPRERRPGGRDE